MCILFLVTFAFRFSPVFNFKVRCYRPEDEPESIFKTKEKKRSKLILPAPQISDREMEQIIKIGHASDSVRLYADGGATR